MIQGLEKFSEYFKGFEDRYTLIGGVACYLNMEDADIDFRATKDLEKVLLVECESFRIPVNNDIRITSVSSYDNRYTLLQTLHSYP